MHNKEYIIALFKQSNKSMWSSYNKGPYTIFWRLRLPGTYDAKIDENQTPLTRFPQ